MMKQLNLMEFRNLYQARHLLSMQNRRTLGLLIPVDIFVEDPLLAESSGGLALLSRISVDCEPDLMAGPTSARIAVVDYDADTDKLEEPVQWDRRNRRFFFKHNGEEVPITREHRDLPQFHQVNVWAVIQSILGMYEATWVLGRSAPWAFDGIRLIVVPHAGYQANALYDRRSKSLQFYYFGPPDQRVYTCLSHDIIALETGRAILDGLRPYYYEDSSMQTTAFHDFVGSLTAILSSLLHSQMSWEGARWPEGGLSRDTINAELAAVFGHYAAGRPYLRSALNPNTMESVRDSTSPYQWAQVLTGAMWDILSGLFAYYRRRPKSKGKLPTSKEARLWAANRFRRVAFQPLDYLPPVDVQFSDYARAVLRADELVDPIDKDDLRGLMRDVFDLRGIDCAEAEDKPNRLQLYASDIDRVSRSRANAYHFLNANRRQLCIPVEQDFSVVDLYRTAKTIMGGGIPPREIVLQYAWREDAELKGARFGRLEGEAASLLCGGTLIFDGRGNVLSWIRKPGSKEQGTSGRSRQKCCDQDHEKGIQRQKQLLDYLAHRIGEGFIGLLERDRPYEMGVMPPVVASRGLDGTLRLEVTPHLRNWTED